MFSVILSCVLLMALTTLFHYEVLRGLHLGLPKLRIPARTKLLVTILVAFVAHVVEIVLYAVTLFALIRYMGVGNLGTPERSKLPRVPLFLSGDVYVARLGRYPFVRANTTYCRSCISERPALDCLVCVLHLPRNGKILDIGVARSVTQGRLLLT